jgi:xanthine dehydrogenase accessory factor
VIAASPLATLEQALAWLDQGEAVALVTLTGIEGSSSRSLGTQMAITAGGEQIGSFSGGCIEAAIVAEAKLVLAGGKGRTVRFGLGSPYIDVRLPCGGGIDLLFTPRPSAAVLRGAVERLRQRQAAGLSVAQGGVSESGDGFVLGLHPPLRILAYGQGEDLTAFVRLAATFGAEVAAITPDLRQCELLRDAGHPVHLLTHAASAPRLAGDRWTAVVFLFHDRDWEDALLPAALVLPGCYHGAIGSLRTHAARLERLRAGGCAETNLSRLKGHIGLIPATRDPATLAVSVLAEVAGAYARACGEVSPARLAQAAL